MNKAITDNDKTGILFELDSVNAARAMRLVATLIKKGKNNEAFRLAKEMEKNIPEIELTSPFFWMTMGDQLAAQKKWAKAKIKYAKALSLSVKKSIRLLYKVARCDINLKKYKLAEKLLLEHVPDLPAKKEIAATLYTIYAKTGRRQEAIALLDRALSINPTSARLWYFSGNNHYRLGNYAGAGFAYRKAMELAPDKTIKALKNLVLLEKRNGKLQIAEKLLEQCLDLESSRKGTPHHCSELLQQSNLAEEFQRLIPIPLNDFRRKLTRATPVLFWRYAYVYANRGSRILLAGNRGGAP